MSKKTGGVVALVGVCVLSVFLASCGDSSSRPSGILYVLSQAANNISSYAVDLNNGNLSLINSNATTTGGLPLSISLDPTAATAFVLSQGAIAGYTVNSDGSLSGPTGGVTLGQTAIAMTPDAGGDFLFLISPGTLPSENPNCALPVVVDPACPSIAVFTTTPGSTTTTLAATALLNRVPTAVSVLTFTPPGGSTKTLLFVTSNLDLTKTHNDNELSVYAVDSSGNLSEQPNSPYTTQVNPGAVLAVNTNPVQQNTGGVFVYVSNQGAVAGSVSVLELCTEVGQFGCSQPQVDSNLLTPVFNPVTLGQNPGMMLVDPTNSFLYLVCTGSNEVFGFRMTTGTGELIPLGPASQPTGAGPVALAMHPNFNGGAEFLYVSNNSDSSITGFSVGPTTGSLTGSETVVFPPGSPSGIAGH